jgi:L-threonylcarbamoyladenylate synthase
MNEDIKNAVEVLKQGGLILYPTDTIWGIGCDATNEQAVNKVYALKKRADSKAMLVLLNNLNTLPQYVSDVPPIAWELIEANDKPMTIIYPGAKNFAPNLVADDGSIGIRIVKDNFCEKLLDRFKKPIVSTSANVSGNSSPTTFHEIGEEIKSGVDYIIKTKQENLIIRRASSIIKLDAYGRIRIIRQ